MGLAGIQAWIHDSSKTGQKCVGPPPPKKKNELVPYTYVQGWKNFFPVFPIIIYNNKILKRYYHAFYQQFSHLKKLSRVTFYNTDINILFGFSANKKNTYSAVFPPRQDPGTLPYLLPAIKSNKPVLNVPQVKGQVLFVSHIPTAVVYSTVRHNNIANLKGQIEYSGNG